MATGKFVWHELMTTDVEAAKTFYSEVIGWKPTKYDGPMEYWVWNVGERGVGGVMLLPDEAKKHGAPPHWLGHVEVPDVDATVKLATERGAKLLVTETIPKVGRFALLQDAQGAVLSAYTPEGSMPSAPESAGDFTWAELNTTDYQAAWKYYTEVFGWQHTSDHDMGGEMGNYFMFKFDGAERDIGGMSNVAKAQNMPPHWMYYITVDDIKATVDRVKALGGQVLNGPMDVPGGEQIAQCMDPQGAAFGLHQSA